MGEVVYGVDFKKNNPPKSHDDLVGQAGAILATLYESSLGFVDIPYEAPEEEPA